MKKYLAILLLFKISLSYSQDWQQIFEQENETYYFKANTDETAWIKVVSPQTEYYPTKTSQKAKIVDGYRLTLWKFDCRKRKLGMIQYTTYSKEGKVLESYREEYESLVDMSYVNPDSIGEGLLNIFCDSE